MIRLGTTITMSLAVAAGIGLFYAKHRVQALEHEISAIQQQILRDREAIHVLHAEWSFLNDPERLAELARRHLEMAPLAGSQIATFADIPEKLPLPPAVEPGAPEESDPSVDGPAEPAPEAQIVAAPEAVVPESAVPVAPAPVSPAPATSAPAEPAAEPSPFADLPPDVQAVLASMKVAQ